jgi:hypothetical protein
MKNENENKTASVPLKAYNLTELARIYDVTPVTMKKWIKPFEKELGVKCARLYTIPQVKMIFENLSLPSIYYEK